MKDQHDQTTTALDLTSEQPGTSTPPATARPEGLTLVHIAQVDAHAQVRKESGMDDESLAELGADILKNGLLQLPLLRRDPQGLRFVTVAGHRRIEAMRRIGFTQFYEIVGDASQEQADDMQLAENIHREQLSMQEIAGAMRKLKDKGLSMDEISERVKKSKSWVSKHLALSCPDFSHTARLMLERGECEDLEILHGINQLDKLGKHHQVMTLRTSDEPLTRDKVRELVDAAKEDKRARDEESKAARKKAPKETNEQKTEREAKAKADAEAQDDRQKWQTAYNMVTYCSADQDKEKTTQEAVAACGKLSTFKEVRRDAYEKGILCSETDMIKFARETRYKDPMFKAGYLCGAMGHELTPKNYLTMLYDLTLEDNESDEDDN